MNRRTFLRSTAAVAAGAAWLPVAHLPWMPTAEDAATTGPLSEAVAHRVDQHLRMWSTPHGPRAALDAARSANPEYDLMTRLFTTLALADVAVRDPGRRPACRAAIDRILADTLRRTEASGIDHWLLGYGRARPFRRPGRRSLFVDGELAAMLGARLLLGHGEAWRSEFQARVLQIEAQLQDGPILLGESYPDECWTFCNTVALAALRMADALDGRSRSLPTAWVGSARDHLLEPETGLLVSSCTWDGVHGQAPEGSSLWISVTCLRLVAPQFAEQQYMAARDALSRSLLGFGWSREWPAGRGGQVDVDSGPVVPGFDASPSASGLALTAARAFGDYRWWRTLVTALNLTGFADHIEGVGGAVLLHGMVHGPLFNDILGRRAS